MRFDKKTKIVATIGPATESQEMISKLAKSGMNVIRMNFSHGDHSEHQRKVDNALKVMKETGRPIALLQDLAGPKIRIGDFSTKTITLKKGQEFILTTKKVKGDETKVYVNYKKLPKELKPDNLVLLNDGSKKLKVIKINKYEIVCKVVVGGEVKSRCGVNLPGAKLSINSLTTKDKKDLDFAKKNDVDFVALSFVRKSKDVVQLKNILKNKKINASVIAKIETEEAVLNIEEIVKEADGLMVARGDLAIEIPAEQVPLIQKMIIERCNEEGKPVITATQMLESMINSPVPTRAEVSDVANAILDGTDAVMLSEETTLGKYPNEAVKIMTEVALEIEENYPEKQIERNGDILHTTDAITESVVDIAHQIGAEVIIALTDTGFTARKVSRFKPEPALLGLTRSKKTYRQLNLTYGCYPVLVNKTYNSLDDVFPLVREFCLKNKIANKGDKIIAAAGAPLGKHTQSANMLFVEKI